MAKRLGDLEQRGAGEHEMPAILRAADLDGKGVAANKRGAQTQRRAIGQDAAYGFVQSSSAFRGVPHAACEIAPGPDFPERDQSVAGNGLDVAAALHDPADRPGEVVVQNLSEAFESQSTLTLISFGEQGES